MWFHLILAVYFQISDQVKTSVLVWYSGMMQLILCLFFAFFNQKSLLMRGKIDEITTEMAIAMTIIAVFGIVGFTTNTEAYKILNPTLASFVRSLEIVFAQIAQIIAFHNFPSPTSIVGSTLVIISVTAIGCETQFKTKCINCLPNQLKKAKSNINEE